MSTIKKQLRLLIEREARAKQYRKELKTTRAEIKDAKDKINEWMQLKKIHELEAGPIKLVRRVSKRLPALNRDFIESSLKQARLENLESVQQVVEFIFDRRKRERVEVETLSMRKRRVVEVASSNKRAAATLETIDEKPEVDEHGGDAEIIQAAEL